MWYVDVWWRLSGAEEGIISWLFIFIAEFALKGKKKKVSNIRKKNYYKILKYISIRYKTFFMYCLAFLTCATIRLPAYANKFIEEIMYHAYYEHKPTSRICNVLARKLKTIAPMLSTIRSGIFARRSARWRGLPIALTYVYHYSYWY